MAIFRWLFNVSIPSSGAVFLTLSLAVLLVSPAARAAEATAYTYAYTSALRDGIAHPASGTNVAAPADAMALAGGASGFASAYAAGTAFAGLKDVAPALQVRAYGSAGGDDHAVAGRGFASAHWSDRLRYDSDLIEPSPPLDFLRMLAIFRFHLR